MLWDVMTIIILTVICSAAVAFLLFCFKDTEGGTVGFFGSNKDESRVTFISVTPAEKRGSLRFAVTVPKTVSNRYGELIFAVVPKKVLEKCDKADAKEMMNTGFQKLLLIGYAKKDGRSTVFKKVGNDIEYHVVISHLERRKEGETDLSDVEMYVAFLGKKRNGKYKELSHTLIKYSDIIARA